VKNGKHALQLYESTDVSGLAQMIVFVGYIYRDRVNGGT